MEIGSVLLLVNHVDPVVTLCEGETTEYFLCSCPTLALLRLKTLASYFIDSPIELSNTSIKDLMCCINGTEWFTGTDSTLILDRYSST